MDFEAVRVADGGRFVGSGHLAKNTDFPFPTVHVVIGRGRPTVYARLFRVDAPPEKIAEPNPDQHLTAVAARLPVVVAEDVAVRAFFVSKRFIINVLSSFIKKNEGRFALHQQVCFHRESPFWGRFAGHSGAFFSAKTAGFEPRIAGRVGLESVAAFARAAGVEPETGQLFVTVETGFPGSVARDTGMGAWMRFTHFQLFFMFGKIKFSTSPMVVSPVRVVGRAGGAVAIGGTDWVGAGGGRFGRASATGEAMGATMGATATGATASTSPSGAAGATM